MQKQIVKVFEAYGTSKPEDQINKFLEANPRHEINPGQVYPMPLSFAGGDKAPGVLIVFTLREAY